MQHYLVVDPSGVIVCVTPLPTDHPVTPAVALQVSMGQALGVMRVTSGQITGPELPAPPVEPPVTDDGG